LKNPKPVRRIFMDFEPLFKKIETAIDSHPRLVRVSGCVGEPEFSVTRLGYSVVIPVKVQGSRKKPSNINASGESFEEAADKLIEQLDLWAEVLAS